MRLLVLMRWSCLALSEWLPVACHSGHLAHSRLNANATASVSPGWPRPTSQFTDGDWELSDPDSLLAALLERPGIAIELMAFAEDDGWYVMWEDGVSEWVGLPTGLHNQLRSRAGSLPGVEFLSCGPEGEWFVRYANGSWKANGLQGYCSPRLHNLQSQQRDVLKVLFGEGTWAILSTEPVCGEG